LWSHDGGCVYGGGYGRGYGLMVVVIVLILVVVVMITVFNFHQLNIIEVDKIPTVLMRRQCSNLTVLQSC